MGKRKLPDDFAITEQMREWARAKVPRLDIDHHNEEFVDHWRANGKMMADWTATWRTWMRRSFEGAFRRPPKLVAVTVTRNDQAQVHDIANLRAAKSYGIDPAGMTDSQINNAIWQAQQKARAGQ